MNEVTYNIFFNLLTYYRLNRMTLPALLLQNFWAGSIGDKKNASVLYHFVLLYAPKGEKLFVFPLTPFQRASPRRYGLKTKFFEIRNQIKDEKYLSSHLTHTTYCRMLKELKMFFSN